MIRESVRKARDNLNEVIDSIREIEGYEHFLKDVMFDDIVAAVESDHPIIYLATIEVGTIAFGVLQEKERKGSQMWILSWSHFASLQAIG